MKEYQKAIVFICVCVIITAYIINIINTPSKINVPEEERWNDLNNKEARDRFCQSEGFDYARIVEYTSMGGVQYMEYAGSPYGYDIACFRSVEEKTAFSYDTYKRWIINLEIKK